MDDVSCLGTETSLLQCTYDSDTSEDNHYEDAGVVCSQNKSNNLVSIGYIICVLHYLVTWGVILVSNCVYITTCTTQVALMEKFDWLEALPIIKAE